MRILIVEDERSLALEIEASLKKAHYKCDLAFTAKAALEYCDNNGYDFVLIDIGLPDKDGFYVLEQIKKDMPDAGVVMLTARGNVEDRIKGLDMGADDYLPKPFSLLELQSRLQAIARRKFKIDDFEMNLGGFIIDMRGRTITYGSEAIDLSKKEFDLLSYLVLHKNKPLTRTQISEHLWGDNFTDEYDSNYIDVHIKNIRKKLTAYSPADWLETVRGVGYKIKI